MMLPSQVNDDFLHTNLFANTAQHMLEYVLQRRTWEMLAIGDSCAPGHELGLGLGRC